MEVLFLFMGYAFFVAVLTPKAIRPFSKRYRRTKQSLNCLFTTFSRLLLCFITAEILCKCERKLAFAVRRSQYL